MPEPLPDASATSALAMAAGLAGMAALHFLVPKPFDKLIPPELPGEPRTWTLASGVAELATAALVANPRTRRLGATLAVALFVAVLPGNLQMVRDSKDEPWPRRAIAWGRLPVQIPLIRWALQVRRSSKTH